mmetsp:Transcript_10076/g.30378  ORF Transcript_10076/g.30378 Transcript_10076/m.30378 type:complete len:208 (-) Transcript_10076:255-878(-)
MSAATTHLTPRRAAGLARCWRAGCAPRAPPTTPSPPAFRQTSETPPATRCARAAQCRAAGPRRSRPRPARTPRQFPPAPPPHPPTLQSRRCRRRTLGTWRPRGRPWRPWRTGPDAPCAACHWPAPTRPPRQPPRCVALHQTPAPLPQPCCACQQSAQQPHVWATPAAQALPPPYPHQQGGAPQRPSRSGRTRRGTSGRQRRCCRCCR